MKKWTFVVFLTVISLNIFAQDGSEFAERRKKIEDKLSENSIVILFSRPAIRSGELERKRYRQNSDFYYLTGYNKPNAVLFLSKLGAILFIMPENHSREDGNRYLKKIKETTGFSSIETINEYRRYLPSSLNDIKTIYTNAQQWRANEQISNEYTFLKNLKENNNELIFGFSNISSLINDSRVIHSDSEIEIMRKAIEITDNAHLELMKSTKPGMNEYQLEALLEYVFKKSGAMQLAFGSIVGSGRNGLEAHYMENNCIINKGDLIVIDIGAEYNMYCADVTRTIPASGKFSDRQKTFYNIVLKSQLAAIEAIKPGVSFSYPNQVAYKVVQEELEKIGFIQKGDTGAVRRYMKHTISHYLGLDVHDVGNTGTILRPGMVITIEPGLYIPEYNFGIRIEDDVLITETGCEVLSKAPKTVDGIEKIMKEKGLGNIQISDISKYKQ